LKVFLGYASGVGKSLKMLDEGRRRHLRGEDVVVGATQPAMSPDIAAVLQQLEAIPTRAQDDVRFMDVEAILRRHPDVCIVDGLAYDNPPGGAHGKRWEDVKQLIEARISVITSVNLQFIEEYRERVQQITGKRVTQTVPLSFIKQADEIEIVDAPPELCQVRAAEDNTSEGEPSSGRKLAELREMALVLAADVVDHQLEDYLERNGIAQSWGTQERILVCVTPRANAADMIASGKRNAERFHGELYVAYVNQPNLTAADQAALENNLALARAAKAEVKVLEGEDPVDVILAFAHRQGVTQIFVGHTLRPSWHSKLRRGPIDRLVRCAEGIDIQVFPH
jgi:two-component system sensor histidine kinase KdpD